jgi:hypothetical protein
MDPASPAHRTFAEQADDELGAFGLSAALLHEALEAGAIAFRACTASHPVTARGYYFYAETVRALREILAEHGWTPESDGNIEYVFHAGRSLRMFVLAGDGATGHAEAHLRSRRSRGPHGRQAIHRNQLVMDLPGLSASGAGDGATTGAWALVHHVDVEAQEVRCELSLPVSIGTDGRVEGWHRRIVLPDLPFNAPAIPERSPTEEIDIEVRRRSTE